MASHRPIPPSEPAGRGAPPHPTDETGTLSHAVAETIADMAQAGFVVTDEHGALVWANGAARAFFEDRLGDRPFAELLSDDTRDRYLDAAATSSTAAECPPRRIDVTGIATDGTRLPFDVSVATVELPEGLRTVAIVRDLRQERRLAADLRSSEGRLQRLVDNASDMVFSIDGHGKFTSVNRACEEVLGYRPDELLGTYIYDYVAPEKADDARLYLARRRAGFADETRFDRAYVRKDGRRVLLEISTQLGWDAHGRTQIEGIARDVTEQRALLDALTRSEAALDRAQALAGIGSWEVDREDRRFWSPGMYRLLGIDPSTPPSPELVLAHVHPDDREAVIAAGLGHTRQRGRGRRLEYRIVRGDGSVRSVEDITEVGFDEAGTVERAFGTLRDITERRRLERRLEQAERLDAMGRLAGGIAHDFNNMLQAISVYAHLLIENAGDAAARRDADAIRDAAERGSAIVKQLLAVGRRQPLQPTAFDLNEVLLDVRGLLELSVGQAVECVFELWPAPLAVVADAGQIQQVVVNLALNARDAMPSGGTVTFRTTPAPMGDLRRMVALTVEDTGVGMEEDVRAHVFEPFFTTKDERLGSGLGLASAYGIVSQSGGTITVSSEPGRGSRFSVLLPPAAAGRPTARGQGAGEIDVAAPAPPGTAPPATTAPAVCAEGRTVLVVDDDPAVRDVVRRVLEHHAYRVLTAGSYDEALATLARERVSIDLLLTDLAMPGQGGLELSAAVAARLPGVATVFMTGFDSRVSVGNVPPGHRLIRKPFSARQLLAEVASATSPGPAAASGAATGAGM